MTDSIDLKIIRDARLISFGSEPISGSSLIVEAARVLCSEYRPLKLENASNCKSNYACFVPAK